MKILAMLFGRASMALAISLCITHTMHAQTWTEVSGIEGQDVGVGRNGILWATAKNGDIYRWNGLDWQKIPGGASRISVDPGGAAWVVNAGNQIYRFDIDKRNWDLMPGQARDIGIGADGSVWCIGAGATQGGYQIFRWAEQHWTPVPGGAVRIAVDPSGNAWVVNNTGTIFTYNGSGWTTRPGAARDIAIGANGAVWCIGQDGRVYRWQNNNWVIGNGTGESIAVTPDGNPWVVRADHKVFRVGPAATVKVRTIFPRGQSAEYQILRSLQMSPYFDQINLGGTNTSYTSLDPLGQAMGSLALQAAEIYFVEYPFLSPEEILARIGSYNDKTVRQGVINVLGFLVIGEILNNEIRTPAQEALHNWALRLYRGIKIRSAKALLDEYQSWKTDVCAYEKLAPSQCAVETKGIASLFSSRTPPQDLMAKNGLQSVMGSAADEVAAGMAVGATAVTAGASFAALMTVLGTVGGHAVGSFVVGGTTTGLFAAFAPAGTWGVGASGALGATGWAGVVAAPVAAAVLAVVVGTIEGFRVVENARVEPMLKLKLGAAMSEPINLVNALSTKEGGEMFVMAFQEAGAKRFVIPEVKVAGEVRFYCQAGYVSRFRLEYTQGGARKTASSGDLSVGYEKLLTIPWDATSIKAIGEWFDGINWKPLFSESLAEPTYKCYTSYGTIFEPRWKTDCPEVNDIVAKSQTLTLTHGGGYVAQFRVRYQQDGRMVEVISPSDVGLGWRQEITIPDNASNIRVEAWSKTGLFWDPWKTIIDKTYPQPPNECIKVYGTTLDPKWNNECR